MVPENYHALIGREMLSRKGEELRQGFPLAHAGIRESLQLAEALAVVHEAPNLI